MTPWVKRLIIANVVVYFLEQTVNGLEAQLAFVPMFAFSHPWTFVTYMFAHASFTHILFNMFALFIFGPRVEDRLGAQRFLTLYTISGIAGAMLSMVFASRSGVVGASGAICGVTLAFAWFWPNIEILIWGILPVKAWILVAIFAVASIFSGFGGSRGGIADFAHLGGYLGAAVYLWALGTFRGSKNFRSKAVPKVDRDVLANYKKVDLSSIHAVNREEVNRILDKISAKGIGSLTSEEKIFLSNFVPMDDRVPPVS
ncbi:MAG: rhomboid family intramembrane serine protease [Gemmatimonadaceae bacterium]